MPKHDSRQNEHPHRHQETKESHTVTGPGETSVNRQNVSGLVENDYGVDGHDLSTVGMEDIGGAGLDMDDESDELDRPQRNDH